MSHWGKMSPNFDGLEVKGMQNDFLGLMQSLAPDLAEEMGRRALVLERIAALQPVGRRQLAARLNLPEREVRAVANVLKEADFITLDAAGMALTAKADEILAASREFSRAMRGLTDMETRLSKSLGVPKVYIAAGNTLAVTGGNTMAQVARFMPVASPLNVMVVPARGGMGRAVETQANTLVAEIARKLGGHHRLMHMPDHMDQAALTEMLKVPEVKEAMELLQRADVILHGIGRADEMAKHRRLSVSLIRKLSEQGAVAEAFGNYFDQEGKCLYSASSVGVDTAILQLHCQMIAVAAGKRKAEAILAVLKHYHHTMLVTDEGAAQEMLCLLGEAMD